MATAHRRPPTRFRPRRRASSGNGWPESGSRPRLLVLNQYYAPGFEATAQLLAQLCRDLARDHEVTVVTGRLPLPGGGPGRRTEDGVEVIRVRSTAFPRRSLALRTLNYLTFVVGCLRAAFTAPRPDAVLCMTDPPVLGGVGLLVARRFGVPLVIVSQDVYPEVAVNLRRLGNPIAIGLLGSAVRFPLKRADRVVAVGDAMVGPIEQKGVRSERVRVIPNWVDTSELSARPRDEWAGEHGLADRFVVMHSGNLGYAQDLDTLIRAAVEVRDLERLAVVMIGDGARRDELVELASRLRTDRVSFLPYQPRESLSSVLSSAHVHVVGLARGLAAYVVPSRIYGILAVGRPVIVAADPESEAARLVLRAGCGVVIPPGRSDLLATEIQRAYAGEYDLEEMGRRGRDYVVAEADVKLAVRRYRSLLREVGQGAVPWSHDGPSMAVDARRGPAASPNGLPAHG